jgi:glycosyltransferase involved in cell wall biosynthesis
MAMKRPVVALRSGGVPEVVAHGRSGLLSEVGDADALAANLARMFGDPDLRRRFGECGRSQVLEYFTPERMSQDLDRVYSRLLGRAPARNITAPATPA